MKKIIAITLLTMFVFSVPAFAAKYKSAVSGKYVKSSYASSHTSTTYKTRR